MYSIFRKESVSALEELESKERDAAGQSPAAFSAFKDSSQDTALEEGKELGVLPNSDGSSTSSSDSSSDESTDSEDGSEDDSGDSDPFAPDEPLEDDDSEDSDKEEEEEESSEDDPEEEELEKDSEVEIKKESMRTLSFLPLDGLSLRQEDFGEFVKNIDLGIFNNLKFIVKALADVGIHYTPLLLSGMLKVVLYTFAKTFKTLDSLFDFISVSFERFNHRLTKQKKTLEIVKQNLKVLQEKTFVLPNGAKSKIKIDNLSFQGSNDLTINLAVYTDFLNLSMRHIQKAILSDFNGLAQISQARYLSKNFDALSSMEIHPEELGFKEIANTGIEEDSDVLQSFEMPIMIGDVAFQAKLPRGNFDTWSMVEKAYNGSKLYLVPKQVNSYLETPVMTPDELGIFINNLEFLVDASEQHQKFYEEILNKRSGMINSIKQLFIRLCEEKVKISFKNSVALPLHLKSSFVTKVYMVAAIDLHDHTARVIANGLSYASAMINLYKVKADS